MTQNWLNLHVYQHGNYKVIDQFGGEQTRDMKFT